MLEPALVILAAGMGSRYGGLKQIDSVGDNGESIIEFSIYEAIKAGFKKVFLIIKKEHQEVFEVNLTSKIRPFIEVEYVYQDIDALPADYQRPADREKPWGTTHALLACKNQVKGPFAIINADDYYGVQSYRQIYRFLKEEIKPYEYGIVAFRCGNTLSDNGSVTRAVCEEADGYVKNIEEIQKVYRKGHEIYYETENGENRLYGDELVSMNYWGFDESVFSLMEEVFKNFMEREFNNDPLKCEHVIPTAVRELLSEDRIKIKVMTSKDNWYGITYQDDKPVVKEAISRLKKEGVYPQNLWKEID